MNEEDEGEQDISDYPKVVQEETPSQAQTPTRDQARIEQLKTSIAKIEEQIERTRRELDVICEALRKDEALNATAESALSPLVNTTENTNTSPDESYSVMTNEQTIEKARNRVSAHIRMLTKYNQLKDVAMGLFELIAEQKGIRVSEVLREEGVEVDE